MFEGIFFSLVLLLIILNLYFFWRHYNIYKYNTQLKKDISTLKEDYRTIEKVTREKWQLQFNAWQVVEEKRIRKDAMDRSRFIIRGQATEHLAPLMFKDVNPKDFRFLGNPIDYVVFDGASDILDGVTNALRKVILLDIKTGNSKLNKIQRRVRDCINEGRVEFLVFNPDKQ